MIEKYAAIKYYEEIIGFAIIGIVVLVCIISLIGMKLSDWRNKKNKKG